MLLILKVVIARSEATWLRSRSRGTSVTDAAYPLRVQSVQALSVLYLPLLPA